MSRYKLSEVVAEIRDEHEQIEIETDDGQVFSIDPPELWPDDVLAAANPVESARAVLGDRYSAFLAAGGSAGLVSVIVERESKARLGESAAS